MKHSHKEDLTPTPRLPHYNHILSPSLFLTVFIRLFYFCPLFFFLVASGLGNDALLKVKWKDDRFVLPMAASPGEPRESYTSLWFKGRAVNRSCESNTVGRGRDVLFSLCTVSTFTSDSGGVSAKCPLPLAFNRGLTKHSHKAGSVSVERSLCQDTMRLFRNLLISNGFL